MALGKRFDLRVHEQELEGVRRLKREFHERHPHFLQPLDRISNLAGAIKRSPNPDELLLDQLGEQRLFVGEMHINGRRRVIHLRCQLPHRECIEPPLEQQLPPRRQNFLACFRLSLVSCVNRLHGHVLLHSRTALNTVTLHSYFT